MVMVLLLIPTMYGQLIFHTLGTAGNVASVIQNIKINEI